MAQKTKTIIKIAGREYTIRANETEEYIHSVAIYVNRKMNEVSTAQPGLSVSMTTILTAMNLADEVIKLKAEIEELNQRVSELQDITTRNSNPPIHNLSRKAKKR